MKLIERYILRRVGIMFLAVFCAAIGITWTVQVLQRINFLTSSGQSLASAIQFFSLFIPSVIPLVMPFALVIAITQTLSTMNQDSELVVINASGSPRTAVIRPVLLFAAMLAVISFLIANFVDPYARYNMRSMLANASADLINVVVQEGSFRRLSDNLYVQIAERKSDGSIGGMFIADSRDANTDLVYYALDGAIANNNGNDVLLMNNGEIQRREVKTGNVSIIKFDQYAFDLSQFTDTGGDMVLYAKDRHLSYLINPDKNDPIFQTRPLQYRAELHKRLTNWLYPFVFAMIALVLAGDARSHREARVSASFSAISLSLIVYWAGYFVSDRAEKNLSYVPVMYLIPLGVIAVCLYALFSGRSLSLPTSWSDRIQDISEQLTARLRPLYERFAGKKNTSGGQS
ncbi:LPS export ABC transporter permease LptF [Pseudochrobactrum sp. XF203]|uniref:LPS export ABC transporter permease LptF n=1 Tax=Pseudochrobactrum sp. XF203 TaxID=2879116 RepID=UPI001CE38BD0|nr:LPS export ABC transporter permease LptF [Pseudochrobactrum sp. XF203]UCA46549.1 LPS export ABC transporter permease LptF [Pseudochrobactrum sp. XF203]